MDHRAVDVKVHEHGLLENVLEMGQIFFLGYVRDILGERSQY